LPTVLITGISGFIGAATARRLAARPGRAVIGTGRRPAVTGVTVAYRQLRLAADEDLDSALAGVDHIVHCAGVAGTWGGEKEYYEGNVSATERLMAAARRQGVERFVFLSSPSIYFAYRHQLNLSEADIPKKLCGPYARTKHVAEQRVLAAHAGDMATVALRPRGVIGAGDSNWLPRIISLQQRGRLIQPGDGQNLADFTAIENLLDAIELALDAPATSLGRAFNITNGAPEPLWGLIDRALAMAGLSTKRKRVPLPLAMAAARANETYHRIRGTKVEPNILPLKVGIAAYSMTLDISLARNYLGYTPRASSDDALKAYFAGDA